MKITVPLLLLSFPCVLQAQQGLPAEYHSFVKLADSLYKTGRVRESAYAYSSAFKTIGWKGLPNDRYNAACSWALAGIPDSAFFNLDRAVLKGGYSELKHISNDRDLYTLHDDPRWVPLMKAVQENVDKALAALDRPMKAHLDSIYKDDQKDRLRLRDIQKEYGIDSKEVKDLWLTISQKDSVNLIKVKRILDTRGWLGPEEVGENGNSALFLVIQHSDQVTQEKYLPMMREAVKNYKASPSSLALLEDRVALGKGKHQIYGSQIGMDANNKYYVLPLDDPDRVDERRQSVGLPPLADYVGYWDLTWNLEQYKKDLPLYETLEKERTAKQKK